MLKTNVRSAPHWRWVLLLGLAVAGCAAQQAHRDGMELLQQGEYEQGVAKLEEANRLESGNGEYRSDLLRARERAASRMILTGNAARIAEQFDAAEAAYREALRVDPNNGRATQGLDAVLMDRRHAVIVAEAQALFKKGEAENASAKLKSVFLENVNNGKALALQREINEQGAKQFAAAPALKASLKKPVTLQFRDANLKMIFESLSKTSGINILLDKDVRAEIKTSIFVKDTSVEDAIDLILLQNQLEKKVLSDNTIFVYSNLPLKHKEYQDLMVRSFHLVYADAKQMQTLLKTILKTKDLYINEKNNSVVMRDTPDAIRLAEKLIDDQDVADPEVIVEVEVLEITRTRLSVLGIQYPDQMTLTPSITDSVTGAALPNTLGNLGQRTRDNLLVSPVPSLTLNAHLDDSDTRVLASPRIRVRNHEKAKIHIGDRLPVITNTVSAAAVGTLPVTSSTVQYLDVGLKLDVEPDIHSDGEVGIKVALEVSTASAPTTNISGTVTYAIKTRTTSTALRLRDGETQVLAGLIDDEDRKSANKIPGLGDLPALGRLFSSRRNDGQKTEIVLAITPRLAGKTRLPNSQSMEFWTGTENALRSAPFALRQTGSVSMSSGLGSLSPVRTMPAAPPRPGASPAQSGAALAQPMSFSWQGPAQAKVGDKFTLMLSTQSAEAVRNLGVVVSFDPAVLKAVDAVEGSFLKAGQSGANFTRDIDQGGGQITLDAADTGDQGFKGSGGVTAITFEVLAAAPQSQIAVVTAAPSGVSGEPLAFAPPAPHSMTLNP